MQKLLALFAVSTSLALAGCGTIAAAVDCQAICSRYSGCFDANYDVSGCESRCRSHSSGDTEYRQAAEECNACISDRACASATFNCGTQCASIVP